MLLCGWNANVYFLHGLFDLLLYAFVVNLKLLHQRFYLSFRLLMNKFFEFLQLFL